MLRSATSTTRAVIGLLLTGMLSGCGGGEGEPAARPSTGAPSPSAPTPTPTTVDHEKLFLSNVSHDPFMKDVPDKTKVALGRQVCADLATGADLPAAKATVGETIPDPDSVDAIVWTAVGEFCPEYDALVDVDLGGLATPQPDPSGNARTAFIAAVHAAGAADDTVSDELIVMLGTTYCDGFTRGDSLDTALGYMAPMPRDQAMSVLRAATKYICPEHADKVAG